MSGTGWLYGITHGTRAQERRAAAPSSSPPPRDGERSLRRRPRRRGGQDPQRPRSAASQRRARTLRPRARSPATPAWRSRSARRWRCFWASKATAARIYYAHFPSMLKVGRRTVLRRSTSTARNRRPPRDPINALLSFAYALLTKDWVVALTVVGFDPLMGFYHQPKYGKPALALDMMEPFRPRHRRQRGRRRRQQRRDAAPATSSTAEAGLSCSAGGRASVIMRLRTAHGADDPPPAVRLPLHATGGSSSSRPGCSAAYLLGEIPSIARPDPRRAERWIFTATSSPTTSPAPSAGERCSGPCTASASTCS